MAVRWHKYEILLALNGLIEMLAYLARDVCDLMMHDIGLCGPDALNLKTTSLNTFHCLFALFHCMTFPSASSPSVLPCVSLCSVSLSYK